MDQGNSQAADAACAIQRLRMLPFTTGSALLQLQTDPHDRWKMECAFSCVVVAGTDLQHSVWLCHIPRGLNVRCTSACAFTTVITIHLPRSGGATSPGQMQRIVTRSFGLLVWPEVLSPDIADSASPPRFHPRYCLARKPRKSPSTLSAFAMFVQVSSGGVLMGGLALVISTPTGFWYSWLGYRHQL